jgi:hypothetical protein
MTSKVSRGSPEGGFLGLLRAAALIAVLAGAAGSVGLMLRAGRRNDSRLLLLLFAIWVLSPFMALILAHVVSKRWSVLTRAALYSVMLAVTLGSLAIYGDVALGPPQGEERFLIRCCSPSVMAAYRGSYCNSRANIAQAVPSSCLDSGITPTHAPHYLGAVRPLFSRI